MMGSEKLMSWEARSGSTNKFPTPNGKWTASSFHYRDKRVNSQHEKSDDRYLWTNDAMTSSDGRGFSVALGRDRYGRTLLRIHPDGNLVGTNGCIGIVCTGEDLKVLENHLKFHTSNGSTIKFFMNDSYEGGEEKLWTK